MTDTPAHIRSPRILFYTVDGLGLGHVTRSLAIARAVRNLRPQTQFLFLTTSEADHVIYREGFSSIKIPSRSAIECTNLWPRVYNKLAQSVVMNAVAAFNPAILVVDTFPAGATNELLSTLSWEMRRAFVFRAQLADRMADPFFQQALSAYDLCIIPHKPGRELLQIPANLKQEWTGEIFIRSREEGLTKAAARERLGLPQTGRVLYVSFGGGGDEEYNDAVQMVIQAVSGTDWMIALADAPLLTKPADQGLSANIYKVSHYPMAEYFNAFDGAISAGGYNTTAELVHFGIPSILIPFKRQLDDQFARVRRFAELGAILPGELDVLQLRTQLESLTKSSTAKQLSQTAQELILENGASLAAQTILGLL